MLARRTRIKGIANIPQRKKLDVAREQPNINMEKQTSSIKKEDQNILEVMKEEAPVKIEASDDTSEVSKVEPEKSVEGAQYLPETLSEKEESSNLQPEESEVPKPSLVRRKFLKPGINLNSVKQRTIPPKVEAPQEISSPSKIILLSEVRIPTVIPKSPSGSEHILNEEPLNANSTVSIASPPKKITVVENPVSDSEYPAPPLSPNKINRARIKAVPKLGLRKASCSASESEDETRKYGRIRNNSVSVLGQEPSQAQKPPQENWPKKEEGAPIQKKVHRSDQSRKLAEARREFYKKFGTTVPDKQNLRMIDLIFYNPSANPLSKKGKRDSPKENDNEAIVDDPKEQDPPEATENNEEVEDENLPVPQIKIGPTGEIILDEQSLVVENKELAKQKEQMQKSNVVDGDFDTGYGVFKKVKRSTPWSEKETLKFFKALNCIGTDFTAMAQLFPKRTRRDLKMKFKKEEKLNQVLVNKAVRQHCFYNFAELKREAQVEAEEEAFLDRLREEEAQKKKEERAEKLKKHQEKFGRKSGGSREGVVIAEAAVNISEDQSNRIAETIEEVLRAVEDKSGKEEEEEEDDEEEEEKKSFSLPVKKRIIGGNKRKKVVKLASSSDEDADVSDFNLSEEEEFIPYLKPTRSGRMPKSTIKFLDEAQLPARKRPAKDDDPSKIKKPRGAPRKVPAEPHSVNASRLRRFSSTSSLESNNPEKLVPGSVVVTTDEPAEGKTEYKVFMVTPERKLTALELDSDVIAMLVAQKQAGNLPLKPPPAAAPDENNVTIPAECADLAKRDNVAIGSVSEEKEVTKSGDEADVMSEDIVILDECDNVEIVTDDNASLREEKNNVTITEMAKSDDDIVILMDQPDNVKIVTEDNVHLRDVKNYVTIIKVATSGNVVDKTGKLLKCEDTILAEKDVTKSGNDVNVTVTEEDVITLGECAEVEVITEDNITLHKSENKMTVNNEVAKSRNVEDIPKDKSIVMDHSD